MIVLTSLAFNTMMFLLMVRVEDPLVPRAMFGILNTLLFFPSGAVYPIQAFPRGCVRSRECDPFTYAVHGFKCLLLKEAGLVGDLARHALSFDLRGGHAEHRDAAVQANAVVSSRAKEALR